MSYAISGAAGTVFAALITGAVALVGLIISKESKLSDFRQAWIDSLRQEIASLVANLHSLRRSIPNDSGQTELKIEVQRRLADADTTLFLIRLRLNETEFDAKNVLETIDKIEDFSNQSSWPPERALELERELIARSKIILKTEWHRVKRGEVTYFCAKIVAIILVSALFIVSLLAVFSSDYGSTQQVSKPMIQAGLPSQAPQLRSTTSPPTPAAGS